MYTDLYISSYQYPDYRPAIFYDGEFETLFVCKNIMHILPVAKIGCLCRIYIVIISFGKVL